MYEIITTRGTFWSAVSPANASVSWPNLAVAQTFVNGWVMEAAYDGLRPRAQDDLDQGSTFVATFNVSEIVAVVNLGDSAKSS